MSLTEFINKRNSHTGFTSRVDPDIVSLDFDIMKQDHANGVRVAETCHVKPMDEHFGWMRGHQNCWTGFANEGKTTFTLYMMMLKSLKAKWKWVVWSPEMKSANFVEGKIKVHYNLLAYELIAMISRKTPYRHLALKYNIPLIHLEEMKQIKEMIDEHFIFIDPIKKDIKSIYELLNRLWEDHGFDGVFIDPFKNIEKETAKREDQHLHDVFAEFKDFAVNTNSVMNWIAHPKSGVSRIASDGSMIPCNQYMLAGGAAWDNSMDGIYSIQRPDAINDIKSPNVTFHNLKQRMAQLVAQRGSIDDIQFEAKTSTYMFGGESYL